MPRSPAASCYKAICPDARRMMNGQRPSIVEHAQRDRDVAPLALSRRRSRSRALLVVLLGLVVLFYAMTIARLGEHAAVREAALQAWP